MLPPRVEALILLLASLVVLVLVADRALWRGLSIVWTWLHWVLAFRERPQLRRFPLLWTSRLEPA